MNRSFIEEIKYQWKYGGMHIKLIGINIAVFLFINLFIILGGLSINSGQSNPSLPILNSIFALHSDFMGFITHPWGLFTSIFAHYGFMHIAFNLFAFYFIAKIFLMYFSNQRMLYTYILGGISGGILQIIAYNVFPALQGNGVFVVGASGAINAVFMAAAFYRPMAEVRLFGILPIKMIYLAFGFILLDLLQMGSGQVAHFAHLGGAIFGYLSIYHIDSKNNIIYIAQNFMMQFKEKFSKIGEPKMKATKGGGSYNDAKEQTDEDYNLNKKKKQEEIDKILDKISKSGYESLSKKEKQILFDQSLK